MKQPSNNPELEIPFLIIEADSVGQAKEVIAKFLALKYDPISNHWTDHNKEIVTLSDPIPIFSNP